MSLNILKGRNNSSKLKNTFGMGTLYEPETAEGEKVIEIDYQSMVNGQSVNVYINNQPIILPLQDYLQDQDFDSPFFAWNESNSPSMGRC